MVSTNPEQPVLFSKEASLHLLVMFTNTLDQTSLLLVPPTHLLYGAFLEIDGLLVNINDEEFLANQIQFACLMSHALYLSEETYDYDLTNTSQVTIAMIRNLRLVGNIVSTPVRIVRCGFYD